MIKDRDVVAIELQLMIYAQQVDGIRILPIVDEHPSDEA